MCETCLTRSLTQGANGTNFCGFSLHNHFLMPDWRHLAYALPLADVARALMSTGSVVYTDDILHATTPSCGNESVGAAHSDHNQSPWSIEKRDNFGDNMVRPDPQLTRFFPEYPIPHLNWPQDGALDRGGSP